MKNVLMTLKGSLTSKTAWLALGLIVLGLLDQQGQALIELLPIEWRPKALLALGILVYLLRAVTSKSLAEKAAPKAQVTEGS